MVRILFAILLLLSNSLWAFDFPLQKIDGHEHEIFLVSYREDDARLAVIRDKLLEDLVGNMAELSKVLIVSSSLKDLGVTIDNLKAQVLKALTRVNSELPSDKPMNVMIYLYPNSKGTDINQLPTQILDLQHPQMGVVKVKHVNLFKQNSETPDADVQDRNFDVYNSLSQSIDIYNEQMFKKQKRDINFGDQPIFLSAVGVQLTLQKDLSAVQLQILTGLKPMKEAKEQKATEVHLSEILIPEGKAPTVTNIGGTTVRDSMTTHPLMLVSTEVYQRPIDDQNDGSIKMKFGAFGGIQGTAQFEGPLALDKDFKIPKDTYWEEHNLWGNVRSYTSNDGLVDACYARQKAVPNLMGKFTDKATGTIFDRLIKNEQINFSIFQIDLLINKENAVKAKLADIRFSVFNDTFNCMVMEKVNGQFLDEIDAAIKDLIKSILAVDDVSDRIEVTDEDWDS